MNEYFHQERESAITTLWKYYIRNVVRAIIIKHPKVFPMFLVPTVSWINKKVMEENDNLRKILFNEKFNK